MDDPTKNARELAAALLAELASVRRAAPDDVPLLAAERAARLCVGVLAACAERALVDPPSPDVEPPDPT